MVEAVDVARHLIRLAAAEEEGDCLTPMRLQKLLYYVQGWHLAVFGRQLFQGRFEAWPHGPVVHEMYRRFAQYGRSPIPIQEGDGLPGFGLREQEFIEAIWTEYRKYTAAGLRCLTHQEPPWLQARHGLGTEEPSKIEITPASMQEFFAQQLRDRAIPGLDACSAYEAVEEMESGGGRSHADVFARLRRQDPDTRHPMPN